VTDVFLLAAASPSGGDALLQYCLIGIISGALISLIALGYTMVYGIVELINFAHGDLFMLGTMMALTVLSVMGINVTTAGEASSGTIVLSILLMLLVVPLYCAGLNWTVDRVVYKPLRGAPKLVPLVSAIGVSFFFMNLGEFWNGALYENGRPVPSASPRAFPDLISSKNLLEERTESPPEATEEGKKDADAKPSEKKAGVRVTLKDLFVIGLTIPIMIGLTLFVKYTPLGKAMRATAQNPTAARLMGINVDRVISMTFLIGGALAGIGSVTYSLYIGTIHYQVGFQQGLDAFTAAVLGGIGNIPGAVLGGLLIGLTRSLSDAYVSTKWTTAMVFGILILILIFRPTGLLGARTREKV
jgi:branched-chain amino acid transport system permease protein